MYVYSETENKKGFGLQERERLMEQKHEREHDDDDGFAINNLSGFFLLGTIFTIIGISIYAGYKIYTIKKKTRK